MLWWWERPWFCSSLVHPAVGSHTSRTEITDTLKISICVSMEFQKLLNIISQSNVIVKVESPPHGCVPPPVMVKKRGFAGHINDTVNLTLDLLDRIFCNFILFDICLKFCHCQRMDCWCVARCVFREATLTLSKKILSVHPRVQMDNWRNSLKAFLRHDSLVPPAMADLNIEW